MSKKSPNSNPVRAVGYCRTSGKGQQGSTSIDNQEQAIRDVCKAEGWAFGYFTPKERSKSHAKDEA